MHWLFILIIFLFPAAHAASWVEIFTDDGNLRYLDQISLRNQKTNEFLEEPEYGIWLKTVYKNNEKIENKKIWYSLSYIGVDCSKDLLFSSKKDLFYDVKGDLVFEESLPMWLNGNPPAPDTVGENLLNQTCLKINKWKAARDERKQRTEQYLKNKENLSSEVEEHQAEAE